MSKEPLIALHTPPGFCVTLSQYEQIKKDLQARFMCGETSIGDSLLAELLLSGEDRYLFLKGVQES